MTTELQYRVTLTDKNTHQSARYVLYSKARVDNDGNRYQTMVEMGQETPGMLDHAKISLDSWPKWAQRVWEKEKA